MILPRREFFLELGALGMGGKATAGWYLPSSSLRSLDEVEETDFRMIRCHVSRIAIVGMSSTSDLLGVFGSRPWEDDTGSGLLWSTAGLWFRMCR